MSEALTAEVELGEEVPTVLYRLYASKDFLLYVGITGNLANRLAQHAAEKNWWPEVVRKTVVLYPSRAEAKAAETAAIHEERPVYNVRDAVTSPSAVPIEDWDVPSAEVEDLTPGELFAAGRRLLTASQPEVMLWHVQMVITAAGSLGQALQGIQAKSYREWVWRTASDPFYHDLFNQGPLYEGVDVASLPPIRAYGPDGRLIRELKGGAA